MTSAWSELADDARAFYAARPWVEEMLAGGSPISTPLEQLERAAQVRGALRKMIQGARTQTEKRSALHHLAVALVDGDVTRDEARRGVQWLKR